MLVELDMLSAVETIGGTLTITKNPQLTQLPLTALQRAGGIDVQGNPALLECPLYDTAARLMGLGTGGITITGNLACAPGTRCQGPVCAAAP